METNNPPDNKRATVIKKQFDNIKDELIKNWPRYWPLE